MKRAMILIAGLMVCGWWVMPLVADEARPRKKRECAPATRPAQHGDMDRPFGPHGRKSRGGPKGGPPFDSPRFGQRMGPHGDLTPKQTEEFMEFAREEFPLLYEHMKQAREKHPGGWGKVAGPLRQRMRDMMQLRHENPELAKTVIEQHRHEMKVAELHRQFRQARTQEERDVIAAEIRSELTTGFKLRLQRLRLEIVQLEKRLEEAKKSLAEQEQNKSALIDGHLEKLLSSDKLPPPLEEPERAR